MFFFDFDLLWCSLLTLAHVLSYSPPVSLRALQDLDALMKDMESLTERMGAKFQASFAK
jgi:hypothetical protein